MATDGSFLFCIDAAQKGVLTRPLEGGTWEPLAFPTPQKFEKLTGIAYVRRDDAVLLLDSGGGQVWRYSRRTLKLDKLLQTRASLDGAALAADEQGVYIGSVAQAQVLTLDGGVPIPLEPPVAFEPGGAISSDQGVLLVSQPSREQVVIWQSYGRAPTFKILTTSGARPMASAGLRSMAVSITGSVEQWRPGALTQSDGIGYVAGADGAVSTFAVHAPNLLAHPTPWKGDVNITSLIATKTSLLVMTTESGRPVRLSRFAPVELSTTSKKPFATALASFTKRTAVPWTEVAYTPALERTLGATPSDFTAVVCGYNPGKCRNGRLTQLDGGTIELPVLTQEKYIDTKRVSLDGGRDARAELEFLISDDSAFGEWKTGEAIVRMNPGRYDAGEVLGVINTTLRLPYEALRYYTILPVAEARRLGSDPDLAVTPLEARPASPQAGLSANECVTLTAGWSNLLANIRWDRTVLLPSSDIRIAVVEDAIDWTTSDVAPMLDTLDSDPGQQPPPPVPRLDPNIREYRPADHGTIVSSMLAAPSCSFDGGSGLVPFRVVVMPTASFSFDISTAKLQGIRLINLSQSVAPEAAQRTANAITDNNNKDVLFVVAAGNEGNEVGNTVNNVPALQGGAENVIVVAATSGNGTNLLSDPRGGGRSSNWGPSYVSLAAPGTGFHGAGGGFSYVPTFGTSFAAPQVTAIAALLMADGLETPWKLKHRLLYTADPSADLPVKAGRLNALRAFWNWKRDLVCDYNQEIPCRPGTSDYRTVSLKQNLSFRFRTTSGAFDVKSPLLRRLTRNKGDGTYRLIYQDPNNQTVLLFVDGILDDPQVKLKFGTEELPMSQILDFLSRGL